VERDSPGSIRHYLYFTAGKVQYTETRFLETFNGATNKKYVTIQRIRLQISSTIFQLEAIQVHNNHQTPDKHSYQDNSS